MDQFNDQHPHQHHTWLQLPLKPIQVQQIKFFLSCFVSFLHLDRPVKTVRAAGLFVFPSTQLYLFDWRLTPTDWKVSPVAGYLIWCWQLFQFPLFCVLLEYALLAKLSHGPW